MGRPVNPLSNRSKVLTWLDNVADGYDNRDKRLAFSRSSGIPEAYIRSVYYSTKTKPSKSKPSKNKPRKARPNILKLDKPLGGFNIRLQLLCDLVKECGGINNAKTALDTLYLLMRDK